MSKFSIGQKVTLPAEINYEGILLYGHECIGKELEVMSVFMDEDTEVCAVSFKGINYCFASRILEPIKSEAEKLREKHINNLISASYPKDEEQDCPSIQIRHAVNMYENGCRMTRDLDDVVLVKLMTDHNIVSDAKIQDFAESIEAYVKGELEL